MSSAPTRCGTIALREISWGQDGDWGREKFVNRNNADLANNFGNLAQRSLSMIAKNFTGRMPARADNEADKTVIEGTIAVITRMQDAMATEQLHDAAGDAGGGAECSQSLFR